VAGRQNLIDLPAIPFGAQTTLGYLQDSNRAEIGPLSVSDAIHGLNVGLLGQFIAGSFPLAGDSHSSKMVVAETTTPSDQSLLANPHHS
jgi:hypothetical protein